MTSMKLHPNELESRVLTFEDLGRQIVALRYDLLQRVLVGMRDEAARQAQADKEKGREKLAYRLEQLESGLWMATESMNEIVRVCQPYIDAEKAEHVRLSSNYKTKQITMGLANNG